MSEELTLREAVPTDATDLLEFLKRASQQSDFISYTEMSDVTTKKEEIALDAIYQSKLDELVVAIFDDDIIGYCRLESNDDHKAEFGVVVDKDFWNNGIASFLMEDALNWAQESPLTEIYLEVYKNNPAAIHIYQKYGFVTELEKENTIIMKKMI